MTLILPKVRNKRDLELRMRVIARKFQELEPSDPFVFGRILTHLKYGVMKMSDAEELLSNRR